MNSLILEKTALALTKNSFEPWAIDKTEIIK